MRWRAVVKYTQDHMPNKTIEFDEYDELGAEIELGPDWNLIDNIQITLNKN